MRILVLQVWLFEFQIHQFGWLDFAYFDQRSTFHRKEKLKREMRIFSEQRFQKKTTALCPFVRETTMNNIQWIFYQIKLQMSPIVCWMKMLKISTFMIFDWQSFYLKCPKKRKEKMLIMLGSVFPSLVTTRKIAHITYPLTSTHPL